MEKISIKASPKQISRLRNGHKVRISAPVEGEGFNLLVSPANYNQITRTFAKGKGTSLQLSPEELMASQGVEGRGIFSDLKKNAIQGIAKLAKDENLKGRVVALADKNLKGSARKVAQKVIDAGAKQADKLVKGGSFLSGLKKAAKAVAKSPIAKMGVDLVAKEAVAQGADPALVGLASGVAKSQMGKGLYAGSGRGLYAGAPSPVTGGAIVVSKRRNLTGYLGGRNQLLEDDSHQPLAMRSDPYGANFFFSTQLPPAMQKF